MTGRVRDLGCILAAVAPASLERHVKRRAVAAMPTAEFRFYEELNDYLPSTRRKRSFVHEFDGTPAVKDVIEGLGVRHTEVDLILVDGR